MTVILCCKLFVIAGVISALLTETIKKVLQNMKKMDYSTNIIALIDAVVIGGIGMVIYYYLTGIPFTGPNIVWICLMILAVWFGSMNGFDKVQQTIDQIKQYIKK